MNFTLHLVIIGLLFVGCSSTQHSKRTKVSILPASQVNWEKLNPARGDKSPQAGTLWGDRKGEVETAFLAKFVDGFSSPPHIHNVSYRAIVIDGLVHNDDPRAANMWMPRGSYWTQPAGEPHITSAKGKNNVALVEIDKGPYLVKAPNQKFENGEHPFNIHASNIIWNKQGSYSSVPLWKNSKGTVTGTMLKFSGNIRIKGESARLVVIAGKLTADIQPKSLLDPGSLVNLERARVSLSCKDETACLLYVKSEENFRVR